VIIAFDNDSVGEAGAAKLRTVLPYIASEVYEYKKPEKDMLEHLLVAGNDKKVLNFYTEVRAGGFLPLSTSTVTRGTSSH
jgi:hypothetical protein